MAKITPSSVLRMMPVDDVVNHSLRYLKVDPDDQSKRCRVVLLPFGEWGECGFSIGRGVASLDFPDNSVIFISMVRSESPRIVLPPSNSFIECPGGSIPSVDNGVIDHLFHIMGDVCSFSVEEIEESESLLSLPMVVESSRMRRRGIPLCTPMIIGIPSGHDGWGDLSSSLWEMMDGFGIGAVIHSPDISIPMTEDGGNILRSAVSSMVPSFSRRASILTNPEIIPDEISVELFHRMAWEMGGEVRVTSESKSSDENGGRWIHMSFGSCDHPNHSDPIKNHQRGDLWEAIRRSLSSDDGQLPVPDVNDVIVEVRTEGVDSSPCPADGLPSNLSDVLAEIGMRSRSDIDWGNRASSIEVRIHHSMTIVKDFSHFRPRPGSSLMINMSDGSRRFLMIPSDIRSLWPTIEGIDMSEVSEMSSFSVQSLSSPRCLLVDPHIHEEVI